MCITKIQNGYELNSHQVILKIQTFYKDTDASKRPGGY